MRVEGRSLFNFHSYVLLSEFNRDISTLVRFGIIAGNSKTYWLIFLIAPAQTVLLFIPSSKLTFLKFERNMLYYLHAY